ncbi:hypothetical protein VDBG_07010 [Verticillium alfalfae VaMs.102]|uniref:Uncharacterized protein n=1 Tax=Verticillium alfalfae (strain VaMs.102 / ATCC MYA-4576 / FGSC 10136) TaxID=526221 RepID=C9SPX5_VERA1|nr:hypothetical protein VDBG_07010 [Verticillium alfalfae VaMs.102]EEY20900.1 hypothetical protein VDBG_07010 [Verticillium alfalfae VaMs.102]
MRTTTTSSYNDRSLPVALFHGTYALGCHETRKQCEGEGQAAIIHQRVYQSTTKKQRESILESIGSH